MGRAGQFLVDWQGYGPDEHCWVPSKDIFDPSLIAEFRQRGARITLGSVP